MNDHEAWNDGAVDDVVAEASTSWTTIGRCRSKRSLDEKKPVS